MTDRFIFRGQDLEGNTLRYGQLTIIEAENIHPPKEFYISNKSNMPYAYPIKPQTVGQCTGLKDKNGKLIYEGDILITSEHNLCKENEKYKVFWHKEYCQFLFESINNGYCIDFMDMYKPEVIGNIYETPELLEAKNVNL